MGRNHIWKIHFVHDLNSDGVLCNKPKYGTRTTKEDYVNCIKCNAKLKELKHGPKKSNRAKRTEEEKTARSLRTKRGISKIASRREAQAQPEKEI